MRSESRKKIIAAILIMLLFIAAGLCFIIGRAERIEEKEREARAAAEEALPEPDPVPSEVLFFASDFQAEDGWKLPSETLSGLLRKVKEEGKVPTNVIYCGDYTNDRNLHDYQLSPDESIETIRSIIAEECGSVSPDDIIFEQGNHDRLTDEISSTGLHEYGGYLVYVLNTQYDFPWKQGRDPAFRDRVIDASEEMKACFDELSAKGESRPVFIAGHVPIHFTARTSSRHNTGDNMYAKYIFDVVNEAAESLDIVYMFGHNHSKGWDCYLGGSSVFMNPGETILIPEAGDRRTDTDDYSAEKLNFTYMNAGYTGYYMNCGPEELENGTAGQYKAADDTLTATVCEIYDNEIVISRYSENGIHPLSWQGEGDPYKSGIDENLIGSEYYSIEKASPAHIARNHAQRKGAESKEEETQEGTEEKAAA